MRVRPCRPPSKRELRTSQIHELVRDFPELHPVLRTLGLRPRLQGGRLIGELLPEGEEWLSVVEEVLGWRGRASG